MGSVRTGERRHLLTLLVAGLTAAAALPAPAADAPAASAPARPRLGLVLAGGGAKGGAHVGVLKVLEEMHVPIDCIAGTSMGALVGAGYASGIPAADIEKFLNSIQWSSVIGSVGHRDLEPIEQKRATITYTNEMEFGLKGGKLVVPGGLVDTSHIENLLREFVARSRMLTNFDLLPIPFRAVATDMLTGEMVVLKDGDISTAMRASMAIPGAFAPVPMGKMVLADGGMVRNIPVDVARNLCADVVIVSNLVEPDIGPEKLQNALQLLSRSMDVMIIANERAQLATLTDRDVQIDIPMGDITTSSFERIPETVPLGETATRQLAARLAQFAVSPEQYADWRARLTGAQRAKVRLAGVEFSELRFMNPEYLEARANIHAGDTVTIDQISSEAVRMSALRDLDSVGYELNGDPDNPVLKWTPQERSYGPNYLKFDFGMYASSGGDLAFALYGAHTRTWVNSLGGEWRNEVQLGYENRLETRFFQPLDQAHSWFVEPRAVIQQTSEDIYAQGDRVGKYLFGDMGGGVDVGYNLGSHTQLRMGYNYVHRNYDLDTGPLIFPEGHRDDAGIVLNTIYDSRDNRFNATSGIAAVAEFIRSDDSLGGDSDWQRGEMAIAGSIPLGRSLIWTTLAGGTDFGSKLPWDRMFTLGGPGSFPGYELGELRTGKYWTASGSYLYKLADIQSLRGQAMYLGVRGQVTRAYDPLDDIADHEIYGLSLYLTGRTPVGPATLGVGFTSRDALSVWLGIGRPIGHGTLLDRSIFR